MSMNPAEFEALWKTLKDSLAPVEKRLAAVEAKGSRAEVAGAVEVVATLPAAGQAGRLVFLMSGSMGLYVDYGLGWYLVVTTNS